MASHDDLALEIFDQLHTVMHIYRGRQLRALREGQYELTPMEYKVLSFVARQPGCTPSDLVQRFGRDKAQLARLLKGLRDRGLLEADADAVDKRSTRLRPSAEGRELHACLRREAAATARLAVDGVPAPERQALLSALAVVRANLEALNEADGKPSGVVASCSASASPGEG